MLNFILMYCIYFQRHYKGHHFLQYFMHLFKMWYSKASKLSVVLEQIVTLHRDKKTSFCSFIFLVIQIKERLLRFSMSYIFKISRKYTFINLTNTTVSPKLHILLNIVSVSTTGSTKGWSQNRQQLGTPESSRPQKNLAYT